MTNLNKTREEIIYELVLSLNNGNSSYVNDRVELAIDQYDKLVEKDIIKEDESPYNKYVEQQRDCNHDWFPMETIQTGTICMTKFKCMKCGATETKDTTGQYYI